MRASTPSPTPTSAPSTGQPLPPPPPPPIPAPDESELDAAFDGGAVLPTAHTLRRGDWSLTVYELSIVGISYGITDHLEATATVLPPISPRLPAAAQASLKASLRFLRGRVTIAGLSSIVSFRPAGGGDLHAVFLPTLLADACFLDRCRLDVGAAAGLALAPETVRGRVTPFFGALHAFVRVSSHLVLLGELVDQGAVGAEPNNGTVLEPAEQSAAVYGGKLLFRGRHSIELALLTVLGRVPPKQSPTAPWLAYTYRW